MGNGFMEMKEFIAVLNEDKDQARERESGARKSDLRPCPYCIV
jgi:hypothetical protein